MDYSTYEQLVGQHDWPKEIEAKSLYRALEQVKDGRARRGVRDTCGLRLDVDEARAN
jgi:hypothetical protein